MGEEAPPLLSSDGVLNNVPLNSDTKVIGELSYRSRFKFKYYGRNLKFFTICKVFVR